MKFMRTIALVLAMLSAASSFAQNAESINQAELAAAKWLALTDGGKFAESWDQTASPFQTAVAEWKWETVMRAVRVPLGPVTSRRFKAATFTTTFPGAPDGEYVVVQFETQFEKGAAVETVTPVKGNDGKWRVSGYSINQQPNRSLEPTSVGKPPAAAQLQR